MAIRGKVVLIIAPDFWSTDPKINQASLSKHHYAITLAEACNEVYFLNFANFLDQKGIVISQDQQWPNIHAVNYHTRMRGIQFFPKFLARFLFRRLAGELKKAIGKKIDIVWSFDPYRFCDLGVFGADIRIFHPVDLFPTRYDLDIAASADILFAPGKSIVDRYQEVNIPAYFLNHGVTEGVFDPPEIISKENLPGKQQIKAVYVGNISRINVDTKSLLRIVSQNPQVDFIIVGPNAQTAVTIGKKHNVEMENHFRKLSHVYFVGKIPFQQIKNYLYPADILLICYDWEKDPAAQPNSHKLLEYMASGKLIVSNYFEIYENMGELMLMGRKNDDLPALFTEACQQIEVLNREALQQERRAFARQYTYRNQLQQVEKLLEKHQLLQHEAEIN